MKVLVKDYKQFNDKLKNIDNEFDIDIYYWVIWGRPAVRKQYRKGGEFVELSIYYNCNKELVSKITKNRIVSENENCMMSTPYLTIKEEFQEVKQASKKNILEKVNELKNIKLENYI